MKANRWIHLVNSAGFIWKPSEFFLTILSRILKSVICWEAVVAWDGCFGSSEQGVLPYCGCLPIRCVYLPILLPPTPSYRTNSSTGGVSWIFFNFSGMRTVSWVLIMELLLVVNMKEREEIQLAFQTIDWLQKQILIILGVEREEEGGDLENKNITFALIKKTTNFLILIHAKFLLTVFDVSQFKTTESNELKGEEWRIKEEGCSCISRTHLEVLILKSGRGEEVGLVCNAWN